MFINSVHVWLPRLTFIPITKPLIVELRVKTQNQGRYFPRAYSGRVPSQRTITIATTRTLVTCTCGNLFSRLYAASRFVNEPWINVACYTPTMLSWRYCPRSQNLWYSLITHTTEQFTIAQIVRKCTCPMWRTLCLRTLAASCRTCQLFIVTIAVPVSTVHTMLWWENYRVTTSIKDLITLFLLGSLRKRRASEKCYRTSFSPG